MSRKLFHIFAIFILLAAGCGRSDVLLGDNDGGTEPTVVAMDGGDIEAEPDGGDAGPDCEPGRTRSCYTGPEGTEGVGLCRGGIQTCPDGSWSTCRDEVVPIEEYGNPDLCDGLDNDCDGLVDQGCACLAARWARSRDGGDAHAIAPMPDDGFVVTGEFTYFARFGPEVLLESAGRNDIFVARYDACGNLDWAKSAGGTSSDKGVDIATGPQGDIFVIGQFHFTATFGSGEPNETTLSAPGVHQDIFVARYRPDGSLAWARRAGGEWGDKGSGVAVAPEGSIRVTGVYYGSATFEGGEAGELTLDGWHYMFIARYETDGTLTWVKRAGGADDTEGLDVAVAPDGDTLVVGAFGSYATPSDLSTTFGLGEPNETTLTSARLVDMFIARFDNDGAFIWVKSASGPESIVPTGIAMATDGTARVTGNFRSVAVFGAGEAGETTLSSASSDYYNCLNLFVASYDTDGSVSWAKVAQSSWCVYSLDIDAGPDGSTAITGGFIDNATFAPDEPGQTRLSTLGTPYSQFGDCDLFVARYDADGSLVLAEGAGTPEEFFWSSGLNPDEGRGILTTSDSRLLVVGAIGGAANFFWPGPDHVILSGGNFIAKFPSCSDAESCDGVDDDCDGTIDEGCQCTDGESMSCGFTDVGTCEPGMQLCLDGVWGFCEGGVGPGNEEANMCDYLDNDCDGVVDEGWDEMCF